MVLTEEDPWVDPFFGIEFSVEGWMRSSLRPDISARNFLPGGPRDPASAWYSALNIGLLGTSAQLGAWDNVAAHRFSQMFRRPANAIRFMASPPGVLLAIPTIATVAHLSTVSLVQKSGMAPVEKSSWIRSISQALVGTGPGVGSWTP